MKTKLTTAILIIISCLLTPKLYAQDGSLDLTFGSGGKVTTTIGTWSSASAMGLQPDGKIVVAGASATTAYDFALVRYNSDGSLDTTFGINGVVTTPLGFWVGAFAMSLQPDGKILVAGHDIFMGSSFALAQYNSNGSLDLTFGTNGKVIISVNVYNFLEAMCLQPNGKILLAGMTSDSSLSQTNRDFTLVRLNSDGSLDLTFDTDGIVTTTIGVWGHATSVNLLPNGKILVGGITGGAAGTNADFALVQYNSNGSLDFTFGTNGKVVTTIDVYDNLTAMSLQPDGKILVAGALGDSVSNNSFILARYNSDGSLDLTFDTDGIVITAIGPANYDVANAISLQPNGKILLAGYSNNGIANDFALVRYNSDGSLDFTFGLNGIVTTDMGGGVADMASAICLQSDGKILLAGGTLYNTHSDISLVRYNNTATVDISTIEDSNPSIRIYPNPFSSMTTIEFGSVIHDVELSIYNLFGQKVKTISNISDTVIQLNLEELANGVYVVSLNQDKKEIATSRIIKTN